MKITAFNGSPRGKNSNTNIMVSAFLAGAVSAGAQVENIYLADMEIKHCKGCGHCINFGGECIIKDDMQYLLPKYVESDIVVFATPLMIDNISGMLKVFMDRTFCIGNPQLEKDENGESRRIRSKYFENRIPPKIVIIANGGYPERTNFQVLPLLMQRIARSFNMEVIAEIYKPQGELLTSKVRELQPIIEDYKKLLHKAGQEIVMNIKLSQETTRLLIEDFLPVEEYFQLMNFRNIRNY